MTLKRLLEKALLPALSLFFTFQLTAQNREVTGTVKSSSDGTPVIGASVVVKGSTGGTATDAKGNFRLSVPSSAQTLTISAVGFTTQDVAISGGPVNVSLVESNAALNEVVVIGYGTARRKDLTGSFATVSSKNFNQVPSATPDQLLQGRVSGLQITVGSGQPGAATTVKIRGNNSIRSGTEPLYVVDGVPLDGRSARPVYTNISGLNNLPESNPLTYLNPNDIESISVLKDASASAIFGSRGANGVILITTRAASSGPLKVDVASSWSVGGLMRQPDVLSAGQYRTALAKYGAKSDSGASYTPFKEIIQHKLSQNYSIALSGGGNENGRFRASFFASSTPGLVRKSYLDKYVGNFNGTYKFLDKKLTLSFGLTAASTKEQIAPVSNDPGSTGSIISNALQWNPTLVMKRGAHSYTVNPNGQVNPLAFSDAYNDYAYVTTLLGYMTASYKIIPSLEYKFLYGVNSSTGLRDLELQGWITGTGGNADGKGLAAVGNVKLFSQTITHTLTFNKSFNDLNFTALAGYEYWTTSYRSKFSSVYDFDYNLNVNNLVPTHYYDNMQDGKQSNLATFSSNDPAVDIQSYFTRLQFNYKDKYNLSASFRADGSNKFGSNNKYAYFPAIAASWNVTEEDFLKGGQVLDNLIVRVGWGKTGNQSFPAGAAVNRYQYTSNGSLSVINFANSDLKWETVTSTDAGIDFSLFGNRLSGTIDAFFKKTTNPLFPGTYAAPAPAGTYWQNLPGYITNKGGELELKGTVIQKQDLNWKIGLNFTYVKNKFVYPESGNAPLVLAGQLNGKGTSATYVQAIANGQPLDVFFLRKFHGYDQNGFAIVDGAASYNGDPNPKYTIGLNTELDYKKFTVIVNMHGSYDFFVYNNTLQSVTGLSFINNGSNISKQLIGTAENVANPVSASTRYMQKGDYMKLGNATIRYNIGKIGAAIKNASVYINGDNLFVLSKYKGFDPEVNVSKQDINGTGIPSIGIDYVGYPSVRLFTVGVSFSLY